MNSKILYFGYGANSQREMMEAITGNKNLVGQPGVLRGFRLCVQRMDQVPESVKKILKESWPDSFETYIIKSGEETDEVVGTVWELTPLERELVRDWELVDFGWYKDADVKVAVDGNNEVDAQTEILGEGQEYDREVNGKDYPSFLNRLEDFQKVAEKARNEYLERVRMQEGAFPKRLV